MLTAYYLISAMVNVLLLVRFRDRINLTELSIAPIALILLTLFQALYFHQHRKKREFNSNNDSDLTEEEWETLIVYVRNAELICLPLYLPFVFFFSSWVKLLSFLLFTVSFIAGPVYYRIKHKTALNERYAKEDRELEEQKKRESLGKWKS